MNRSKKTVLIGQDFKQIREQRGWSLQQASKVTRIRADLLDLIEQDRLEKFHNPSYLHALIRIYSLALGLNPEVFLERLEKRPEKNGFYPEQEPPRFEHQNSSVQAEPVIGLDDRAKEWGSKLVGALVALVIIAIVAIVYQTIQNSNPATVASISKESTTRNPIAPEETPLPVIPRERLQAQNRPNPQIETSVVSQSSPLASKPQPRTTAPLIETPVTDYPSPQAFPVVRPSKVLNIPAVEKHTIVQNTNTPSSDQLTEEPIQEPTSVFQEQEPVLITQEMPIRAAIPVSSPLDTTDVDYQEGRSNTNSTTDSSTIPQQTQQSNEFVVLDEVPLAEEEVTLTDEQFRQLLERSKTTSINASPISNEAYNSPALSGPRGATSAHAAPARPSPNSPASLDIEQPDSDTQSDSDRKISVPLNTQTVSTTQLPIQNSASLSTPAIDTLGDALNQLRLELSKEAYVRVFVNDIYGEPSLDDVLPAGSAASWEGHTFYVTIRPANAATFYYNGQRYDYTNRGPENVTLRFP